MLKKVIIGILSFMFVAVAGAAAYIYTLDWNKHKVQVSQKLTQITGLRSKIDGNLKVEFFPMPKITAGRVSFFSNAGGNSPLIEINEITANLELEPLLNNNFIVKSMTLTHPTANININKMGVLNWKDVGKNSHNKSGNVVMSFNDIRLDKATIAYKNEQNNTEFSIPNITASISAPSLAGPYKTSGKFIHNNSEIKFNGNILNDSGLKVKMSVDNAATGSKLEIDGETGAVAKGNLTFDTRSLADIGDIILGADTFRQNYREPFYLSFQYDLNNDLGKLDNFNLKYGNNNVGNGNVLLKLTEKNKEIAANINMAQFNLSLLEQLSRDYIDFVKKDEKNEVAENLSKYTASLNLKATHAAYKESAVQNLSLELSLKDGILGLTRFSALFPGETNFKTAGKVNLNERNLPFIFNQAFDSKNLRTFASLFDIDLGKMTPADNKKSVFQNATAELKLHGDVNTITVAVPSATIDSTDIHGNAGFILNEETLFVLTDFNASKIIFDKYLQALPENMQNASYKEKFIYQMNLIPWNKNINVEANVAISSAVYNMIPMENIILQFASQQDNLNVKKLSLGNIAGAQFDTQFNAKKVFTEPTFSDLTYSVKTSNFPYFISTMGFDNVSKELFKRKIFAAQGNLSGTFNEFNLSSVQKFGETEFSFTGVVANPDKQAATVNGDFEFKTNNALNFIKALNLDYTPDIPVTSLTASGNLKGTYDLFEYSNINAFLGANNIKGYIQLDNSGDKPILKSEMTFDKFDADRWFNISKKNTKQKQVITSSFISFPAFDNSAINYDALSKVNFDVKAKAGTLTYGNKVYGGTQFDGKLKDGILKVNSFHTQNNTSDITLNFVLDSGNMPTIEGKYDVSGIKIPALGGETYLLESGILNTEGTFSSSAYSKKEFLEQLNSDGEFKLQNTAMKGWDLDIIKFDLEQRKETAGFEELVLNNLRTGKSAFNKISGAYKVNKGVLIADKVILESPVADMNMQLNLNLSDKLFTAVFGVVYHNASFSDILNFTMKGYLAEPSLEVDLSESLQRIGNNEKLANTAKEALFKEKREKLSGRINKAQAEIVAIQQEISKIEDTATKFKPITANRQIAKIYDDNLSLLQEIDSKMEKMSEVLSVSADEKTIMDIESQINVEKSKLRFIPKAFEDNFVTDSKNAFDETLNKITWVYNVATNNAAYYNELTDVFIKQMETLKKVGRQFDEKEEEALINDVNNVSKDMEKIDKLYAKVREDYLFVLDTANAAAIQDNNTAATASLKKIATYTNQLNANIIDSLKAFRKILDMRERNDKEFLIYPSEDVSKIDATKPTAKAPTVEKKQKEDETKPDVVNTEAPKNEVMPVTVKQEQSQDDTQLATDNPEQTKNNSTEKTSADTPAEVKTEIKQTQENSKEEKKTDKNGSLLKTLTNLQNFTNGISEFVKKLSPAKNEDNIKLAIKNNSGGLAEILQKTKISDEKENNIVKEKQSVEENKDIAETVQEVVIAEANLPTKQHAENIEVVVSENVSAEDDNTSTSDKSVIDEPTSLLMAENQLDNNKFDEEKIRIATEKADSISEVISKTKVALNDILETIKQAEQNLQDEVKVAEAIEKDVPTKLVDIAKYTIPVEVSDNKKLKRNPVIAMNIGKELQPVKSIDSFSFDKAFKTKKKQFKNVLTALPTANPIKTTVASNTAVNKATNTENNADDIFDIAQNVVYSLPNDENSSLLTENGSKYVFTTNNLPLHATGIVRKSATERLNMHEEVIESGVMQKFLFASNGVNLSPANGVVGKKLSLFVK